MLIDGKIAHWMKQINNLKFVKTTFSCQGHYCKKPVDSILYYYEESDSWNCCVANSRTKFPYVLMKFNDRKSCSKFVKIWLRIRRELGKEKIMLYYITERNLESVGSFGTPSVILSKFGKFNVSITFLLDKAIGTPYYRNKKRYDAKIQKTRDLFFEGVVFMLKNIKTHGGFE